MTTINEHTTEVGEKMTNDVNLQTITESDRVIGVVGSLVELNTQPPPDKIQMAAKLASTSTTVGILNSILAHEGIAAKGTKEEKAAYLADSVPTQRLITLRAEHAGTATAKAKTKPKAEPKAKPELSVMSLLHKKRKRQDEESACVQDPSRVLCASMNFQP